MDELELFFSEIDAEEVEEFIADIEAFEDEELSLRIKKRLDITDGEKKIKRFPLRYIVPAAAMLCFVVAGAVIFLMNQTKTPQISTQAPTTVTEASAPVENPLMLAISLGDDDLISKLLTLPSLISQETLDFALNFSNLLSYQTIHEIAISAKEKLGSTGLDSLLESSLFGDSKRALDELRKRDGIMMTPFEKLAFFFAVAFCDSEVVDEFVKLGYDINIKDLQGNSIYAIAEKYGNEDNMQYAISKGITS